MTEEKYRKLVPLVATSIATIFSRSNNEVFRSWCANQLQTECNKWDVEKTLNVKLWDVVRKNYSVARQEDAKTTQVSQPIPSDKSQEITEMDDFDSLGSPSANDLFDEITVLGSH